MDKRMESSLEPTYSDCSDGTLQSPPPPPPPAILLVFRDMGIFVLLVINVLRSEQEYTTDFLKGSNFTTGKHCKQLFYIKTFPAFQWWTMGPSRGQGGQK